MGIYDREYVRRRPTHGGVGGVGGGGGVGLPAMKGWSINTWIIAINIAVFMIDALLFSAGAQFPVNMGEGFFEGVTEQQRDRAVIAEDPETGAPAYQRSARSPGGIEVALVDGTTGEKIGARHIAAMGPLQAIGHFSTAKAFFGLEIWRFIGFQFLHANLTHLIFNMIGLFFFGGLAEQYLGRKRYLAFYLFCGIAGALMYLLLNLLGFIANMAGASALPGLLVNDIYTPLIGASAGVFGILMAAAYVAPNTTILVMFILPMKLATAVYAFVLIAALNLLLGGSNAGGDAAHLGGALAGFVFIRRTHLLHTVMDFIFGPKSSPRRVGGGKGGAGKGSKRGSKLKSVFGGGDGGGSPSDSEVDRILAKVANQGIHSLSDKERKTLREATDARR